ncbi:MAG: CDP-alcohol phosphatidyltransferase family protein [Acidimicrobiia bacterium]
MPDEQVSDRIVTIPNLVTFVRLLGVGVFWWVLLVEENIALAAGLIFLIGWTDWIDGYLARKLDQVSKLGTTLDPIADRLMIASAVIGGMIVDPPVVPLVIGFGLIVRELFMGVVVLRLLSKSAGILEVRYLGKVSTFILYGAIPLFYLAEIGFLAGVTAPLAWVSGVVGLAMYWYVAFQYLGDARQSLASLESASRTEEK